MKQYGLLGKTLQHSFSKKYFTDKFEKESLPNCSYELYEIAEIALFPTLVANIPNLCGMNVTIPYKQQVIPFLSELDISASKVGAVNVIKFEKSGKTIGYNSDYYGFMQSLINLTKAIKLDLKKANALLLGTGGASKAVAVALTDLGVSYKTVSRDSQKADYSYIDLNDLIIKNNTIIVNCSPVGTFPDISQSPDLPYQALTSSHLLYDLVYNPVQTMFMTKGLAQKAIVKNGLEMLELQAEKAWEIWNS